jgi:hypothetical protein
MEDLGKTQEKRIIQLEAELGEQESQNRNKTINL